MADGGIDDFHNAVLQWVENLGLEGEEAEEYVSFHMEKGGYKRATTWLPPEPEEGKTSGFMSGGKKRAAARPGPGQGQGQRAGGTYFGKPGGK